MELWIRSQDKEVLMLINTIALAKNEEGTIIGYGVDGKVQCVLGNYKTKERALKVLDEIQEAKLGNFHYKCPSNVKVSTKEDTIVYQMPEE